MWYFQLRLLLVALSASVLLATVNRAPQKDVLDDLLQAEITEDDQDLSGLLLLKTLSDVMRKLDNEVMPGMKELEFRRKVVRQLPLSQRMRKAGCRNFFWKTFTSC